LSHKIEKEIEKKKKHKKYLFKIFFITLILSATFNMLSAELVEKINNIAISIFVLALVVAVGVLFDIIGTAVTAADEVPFHAKAADKKNGAKESVKLIKNASQVSNVCSDVVGDICGVLSGATAAMIATSISKSLPFLNLTIATLLVTAIVTALTVWLKGLFKQVAINNSEIIIEKIGIILHFFSCKK